MKLRVGTNGKNEMVLIICDLLGFTTVTEMELENSIEHWFGANDLDEYGKHWAVKDSYYENEEPQTMYNPGYPAGWVIENYYTFDDFALFEGDELEILIDFINNNCETNSFNFTKNDK